jgi:hypothetical protein
MATYSFTETRFSRQRLIHTSGQFFHLKNFKNYIKAGLKEVL